MIILFYMKYCFNVVQTASSLLYYCALYYRLCYTVHTTLYYAMYILLHTLHCIVYRIIY